MHASSPLNHEFTQSSHPKILLQHFVAITGGLIGILAHIAHLKVSLKRLCSAIGTFVFEVTDSTFDSISLMAVISAKLSLISFRAACELNFDFCLLGAMFLIKMCQSSSNSKLEDLRMKSSSSSDDTTTGNRFPLPFTRPVIPYSFLRGAFQNSRSTVYTVKIMGKGLIE